MAGRARPDDDVSGTPRWVKVSAIIALALIVLVVVALLVGGGNHGPGRHSSGDAGGQTPSSSVAGSEDAADHTPPAGSHAT